MANETVTAANVHEGPGKGKAFFDRAKTVAESGNFDYAIDMYIEGLSREPQLTDAHEALREVALRRKVTGGKPATSLFGAPSYFKKAKSPKELMLNQEWVLAKDPGNISVMRTFVKHAAAGGYTPIMQWFLPILLQANRTQKSPSKELYLEIADWYEAIKEYGNAIAAVNDAVQMNPADMDLHQRMKNLSANHTLIVGRYEEAGDFKESIKDKQQTKDLMQEDSLNRTEDYKLRQVELYKQEYEKNPKDHQIIVKYVKTLLATEQESYEAEAMKVLNEAYVSTKTYSYRATIHDTQVRQMKRRIRDLKEKLGAATDKAPIAEQLKKQEHELLTFELTMYKERTEHYPTDMHYMFEYGKRQYLLGNFDEAIRAFQQSQNTPKYRTESLHNLGRAFLEQGFNHEATQTLKAAVDSYEHALAGDKVSKELNYWLGRAYELDSKPEEAQKIYSQITLWDITFRDVRARLEGLRKK